MNTPGTNAANDLMKDATPLRVGRIPFLVCAPYFHASLAGRAGIVFTDGAPRVLNRLLAEGTIDAAPSSSFEYARNAAEYVLIPGLCTSGRGEVKSVLLLSREPWERLDGRVVRLSPDSDTSNALVRVLSRFHIGVAPIFRDPDEDEGRKAGEGAVAMTAIGDAALRAAASGDWPYRYDLARVWQQWQGTPLPLGVWILRADAAAGKRPVVSDYVRHLRASLAAFFVAPDERLDAWERAYGIPLARPAALDFFSTADYVLTSRHEEALRSFFGLCADAGLLPGVPELRWFGDVDSEQ